MKRKDPLNFCQKPEFKNNFFKRPQEIRNLVNNSPRAKHGLKNKLLENAEKMRNNVAKMLVNHQNQINNNNKNDFQYFLVDNNKTKEISLLIAYKEKQLV